MSPKLKAAKARLKQAEVSLSEAKQWWYPKLSLYANEGRSHIRQDTDIPIKDLNEKIIDRKVGLKVTVALYEGGKLQANVLSNQLEASAAYATYMGEVITVRQQAAKLYADVFLYQQLQSLLNHWAKEELALQNHAKEMLAKKRTTVTNLASIESSYAAVLNQQASNNSQLLSAEFQLSQLLGHKVEHVSLPQHLPWDEPSSLDDAFALAMQYNPSFLAAQFHAEKASIRAKQAKKSMLPHIAFYSSFEREWNGARFTSSNDFTQHNKLDTTNYGIELTMPLLDGSTSAEVRRAEQELIQEEASLQQMQLSIRAQVSMAWRQLKAAKQRLRVNQPWLTSAKQAFAGIKREYGQKIRTIQDVIAARQQVFLAEKELLRAKHDMVIYSVDLHALTGQLAPSSQSGHL
jgi:outer membrane protein